MKVAKLFARSSIGLVSVAWVSVHGMAAADPAQTEGPQTWAIVVGVDAYKSVTPLQFAGNDAKLFAQTLQQVSHVPDDHVFLFTSDAKTDDLKPSVPNVLFRLEKLEQYVKSQDTVVFYFAGHGMCMEGETFLLTEEADNRSKRNLVRTSLPGSLIFGDYLAKLPAKNTLVILDACRNDPEKGRATGDNLMTPEMSRALVFGGTRATGAPEKSGGSESGRARATLMACSDGERSYEWRDRQHGYFTYFLVEGLKSGAVGANQKVTLQSLTQYVEKQVTSATRREQSNVQTPKVSVEGTSGAISEWVLASYTPLTTSVVNVAPPPKVVDPQLEIVRQQLVEKDAKLQIAERDKVAAEQRAKAEEAKRLEAEAKTRALESQLAMENSKTKVDISAELAKKLQEDLVHAQEELELAKGATKAAELRVSAADVSKAEALARAGAAEKVQIAMKAQLQNPGNPEAERLAKEASELQEQLKKAQDAKDRAELRARQAESQLAATQGDVEQRRILRTSGKKPTGRTDPSRLWQVEEAKDFDAPK